jgi:hypothetical protein
MTPKIRLCRWSGIRSNSTADSTGLSAPAAAPARTDVTSRAGYGSSTTNVRNRGAPTSRNATV